MNGTEPENSQESVNRALGAAADLSEQYSDYPPIFNSKLMLQEIFENWNNKDYLFINQNRLNVGLLAAKALDFEEGPEGDQVLSDYAGLLHKAWGAVLNQIGQAFQPPTSGPGQFAYKFYQLHGYDDHKTRDHMTGIDFNFPVAAVTLKERLIIGQWKTLTIPQGDYYADINNSVKPDCLGINNLQQDKNTGIISRRIEHHFELQNRVDVLKSVAAAVPDTWSVKGPPKQTSGGCTQYFNANNKKEFDQIYPQISKI